MIVDAACDRRFPLQRFLIALGRLEDRVLHLFYLTASEGGFVRECVVAEIARRIDLETSEDDGRCYNCREGRHFACFSPCECMHSATPVGNSN